MNVVFMGTPDFAVPSLEAIYRSVHTIKSVVTVPDRHKGRGQKVCFSDVKNRALDFNLPILQPEKLSDPRFLKKIRDLQPDIMVVVAYRILPKAVYEIPKYGAINAHASLLPKYRGAAPIHWAVFNGEKETGVTIFQINKKVDTGAILLRKKVAIEDWEKTTCIYNKLKFVAPGALLEAMSGLEKGILKPIPQDNRKSIPAPKVTPEHGRLDFSKSCDELMRTVRAFGQWPGTWFMLNGKRIKVYEAMVIPESETSPGKTVRL